MMHTKAARLFWIKGSPSFWEIDVEKTWIFWCIRWRYLLWWRFGVIFKFGLCTLAQMLTIHFLHLHVSRFTIVVLFIEVSNPIHEWVKDDRNLPVLSTKFNDRRWCSFSAGLQRKYSNSWEQAIRWPGAWTCPLRLNNSNPKNPRFGGGSSLWVA